MIKYLMLASLLALGACQRTEDPTPVETVSLEDNSSDAVTVEPSRDDKFGDVSVWTDPDTGCQYLRNGLGGMVYREKSACSDGSSGDVDVSVPDNDTEDAGDS